MMKRFVGSFLLCCLCFAASVSVQAQEAPPGNPVLDSWVGSWSATGTMMGAPAAETVTFEWILGGWFLQGHHATTVTMPDGSPMRVESLSLWQPAADGTFMSMFLDSTGQAQHGQGAVQDSTVAWVAELGDGSHTQAAVVMDTAAGVATFNQTHVAADGTEQHLGTLVYTRVP